MWITLLPHAPHTFSPHLLSALNKYHGCIILHISSGECGTADCGESVEWGNADDEEMRGECGSPHVWRGTAELQSAESVELAPRAVDAHVDRGTL